MAKIRNVLVNIQIGKREYSFKNLILDNLLNFYASAIVDDFNKIFKQMNTCLISFSKLDIKSDMVITNDAFDIGLFSCIHKTIGNQNKIVNKYVYTSEDDFIYDYSKKTALNIKLGNYVGKKINTIGFSYSFVGAWYTTAVLDVSNYDIYIQEGEELRITRIDEVSTDAIFTSLSDKVISPIHLYTSGIDGILPAQTLISADGMASTIIHYNAYARLTNFGFGNKPDNIDLEYDIEGNYEVNENIFSIKKIWSPKGLYPSKDLYPSDDLYPDDIPYEYLILKFKLFQKVAEGTYEDYIEVEKFTGAEYLQAIPLDKRGNIDLNIKYERG